MSAEKVGQTADLTTAGLVRWAGARTRERNFWIALACAALLHASLFVGAIGSKPKMLGDPTGAEDAISVSLVTEADLQSRATVAEEPTPPPSPQEGPANPAQQRPPEPPKPEAKQEPQPKPPEPETQEAQPAEPPQADPVKPDAKPDEQKVAKEEEISPDNSAPDLLSLQEEKPDDMRSETKPKATPKAEAAKPAAKPQQQKPQKKKLSSLDLSTPQDAAPNFGGSRSAGLQRPPGITRSGVNDAFARAVIRALQQTMPQLTDKFGRVTVRILLSENGNVVEVRLLQGSKDSALDQDVVFAARQTSYPIPPVGSNLADRTFMVTYIYD